MIVLVTIVIMVATSSVFASHPISDLLEKTLRTNDLDNKKTIFFSPDGELHNIAIEYIPYTKKIEYISDVFQIYRLSSTRELLNRNKSHRMYSAALFGDMAYDAPIPSTEVNTVSPSHKSITRGLTNILVARNGFNNLSATKLEVDSICQLLSQHILDIDLFTGISGTEGAFKHLSESKCSIVHIATHGVYWDKESFERAELKLGNESEISSSPLTYVEDRAMTRSALLFSRANATIKNGSDNAVDDGILTA